MGSPLSPFLADLFMDDFERQISMSPIFQKCIFWRRYVDDIFGIFNGPLQELDIFLKHINSIKPEIQFTSEIENNNSLPFLDLYITKQANSLKFSIFRKPTTTDHAVPYHSAAPLSHKLAGFRFLFNRLFSIPLEKQEFRNELNLINYIADTNGYPSDLINNLYKKIKAKFDLKSQTTLLEIEEKYIYLPLSFHPSVSQKIANFYSNKTDIRFSFSTSGFSLKDHLCKLKDPIKPLLNSGVYKLNCPCGHFYIGMTTRNFQIRTKEHINQAFTHSHMNSAFATHISTCKHFTPKHRFTFKPEILHKNNNFHILSSLEAIEIAQQRTSTFLLNNITDYSNSNFINNLISNSIFN